MWAVDDGPGALRLEVECVPGWGSSEAARGELSQHLATMFSHPEREAKSRGAMLSAAVPGLTAVYDLKESVQALFVRTFQGHVMHKLICTASCDPAEPDVTLFVHHGMRRLPDGRPLLHVPYVDHTAAARTFPTMASRHAPFARFGKVMRRCGDRTPTNQVSCTPDELQLLRLLLARNAGALQPPRWQRRLLELPSEWGASFLVPLYSDYVVEADQAEELIDRLPQLLREQQARHGAQAAPAGSAGGGSVPASSGSSASASRGGGGGGWVPLDAAQMAAAADKEAGNRLFKAGDWAAAAERYSRAAGALAAGGAGQGSGAPAAPQLLLDCLNNLALALVRQAEA